MSAIAHTVRSGSHDLHVLEYGNASGQPVVVMHGGPGAGSDPRRAELFDLDRHRVILVDQRGCGMSKPCAGAMTVPSELDDCSTPAIIADFALIKSVLGISGPWIIAGNSYGAALAVIYSVLHPDDVCGLLLSGTFLCRDSDVTDMFQPAGRASLARPEAYRRYLDHLAAEDRSNPLRSYGDLLWSMDPNVCENAAWQFVAWNRQLYNVQPLPDPERTVDEVARMLTFARLTQRAFSTHFSLPELFGEAPDNAQLLAVADRVPDVPIRFVHGELDLAVSIDGARLLASALAATNRSHDVTFRTVANASHSSSEPGVRDVLREEAWALSGEVASDRG